MDINEAIRVVKSNWPDERYTMLRQALAILIYCPDAIRAETRAEALERAEMALALMFDMGEITRDKAVSMMRSAILADGSKTEKEE